MKVVAVGECTIDRYLDAGVERAGGISLNFAVNARRAGADDVALVSCTGTDSAHAVIGSWLASAGIDATYVHSLPGSTASQTIWLAADGERVFPTGGYDPGVLADCSLQQAAIDFLRGADIVAVPCFRQIAHIFEPIFRQRDLGAMRVVDLLDGTDLDAVRALVTRATPDLNSGIDAVGTSGTVAGFVDARRAGEDARTIGGHLPGFQDESIISLLDAFDIVFISGNEGLAQRLLPWSRRSRSVLVVTHGAAGSSALVHGVRHVAPAEPVPASERIDTTGCGDAFQAAFTVDYFRNRDVRSALREGARRAAVVIRHLGATSDET